MSADILLQHLQRVKSTGQGRWMACCPAHDDKSPSLSIREIDGEKILVHCFGGCDIASVLSAVGLTFDDLFPQKESGEPFSKGERRPFPAADILRAVAGEAQFVYLCAQAVSKGEKLLEQDLARLLVAASRIQAGLHAGGLE